MTKVIISGITKDDFARYVQQCIDNGYSIDSEKKEKEYHAYNQDGCKVDLKLEVGKKEMSVELYYPLSFTDIRWPKVGISTLLPKPKHVVGKVVSDYDWAYAVYVKEIDFEGYKNYVDKCIEKGFNKDIRNYDTSYWADYAKDDDITLNISYEGFNTIKISIHGNVTKDYSSMK